MLQTHTTAFSLVQYHIPNHTALTKADVTKMYNTVTVVTEKKAAFRSVFFGAMISPAI
jgi:hypothetical protein